MLEFDMSQGSILPEPDSVNRIHKDLEAGVIDKRTAALRLADLARGNMELLEAGTAPDPGFLMRFMPSIIKDGMSLIKGEGGGKKK